MYRCSMRYLDDFAFANLEFERFVRLSIAVKLLCTMEGVVRGIT